MKNEKHAVCNGKIISEAEAVVPVTRTEIQCGYSVYESLRIIKGQIVHFPDHFDRLKFSADFLKMDFPLKEKTILQWINKLIKEDNLDDATIRLLYVGGEPELFFVTWSPILSYPAQYYINGVKTIVYKGERYLPKCKTSNLLMNYLARLEAGSNNAFEALLENRNGQLLEGTRSNFYAFKNGVIYTAPLSQVLQGVTRIAVFKAAEKLGINIIEESPLSCDIDDFEEAFISATSMGAMPLSSINEKILKGPFERTNKICELVRKGEL